MKLADNFCCAAGTNSVVRGVVKLEVNRVFFGASKFFGVGMGCGMFSEFSQNIMPGRASQYT